MLTIGLLAALDVLILLWCGLLRFLEPLKTLLCQSELLLAMRSLHFYVTWIVYTLRLFLPPGSFEIVRHER